jgi:hypothetical protein
MTAENWRASLDQQEARWRRFEEWENSYARQGPRDYRRTLEWMANAWEIASRHSRWWNAGASAEDHWAHLAEIQRRLRRLRIGV